MASRASTSKLWRAEDSSSVALIAGSLLRSRHEEGWYLSTEVHIRMQALCALMQCPPSVRHPWAVLGPAFRRMSSEKSTDLDRFQAIAEEELASLITTHRRRRCRHWLLLPIKLPATREVDPPRLVRLFGQSFGFMHVKDLRAYLGERYQELEPHHKYAMRGDPSATVVTLEVNGFPLDHVWQCVSPAFEALRGAIEWSLHAGVVRLGGSAQLGSVPHPTFAVCIPEKGPASVMTFSEVPDWEVEQEKCAREGDRNALHAVFEFGRLFPERPSRNSIDSLIADLLRLYGQAMEQRFVHGAALGFWQMAEALTLEKKDRGAGDKVVARLAWFERFMVNAPTDASSVVLRMMLVKRNAAVHQGLHFRWEQLDLVLLKEFCEAGLRWLIRSREFLGTHSKLGTWWEHMHRDEKELKSRASVIARLRRELRQQKAGPAAIPPFPAYMS